MPLFYSPTTNSCYAEELFDKYKQLNTLPGDIFKLSKDTIIEFFNEPKPGFERFYIDGKFEWIKLPQNLESIERVWRNSELSRSDIELYKLQDSTHDTKESDITSWREYRRSLREWPAHESFPNEKFRPKHPQNN